MKEILCLTFDVEQYGQKPGRLLETETVPKIIEILKKYNVKATFFVLGEVAEKFPELVRLIYDEVNEIGSHSYAHKRLSELSWDEIEGFVRKGKETVENVIGAEVRGFRAPYADFSTNTYKIMQILKEVGYVYDSSLRESRESPQEWPIKELFCDFPLDYDILETREAKQLSENENITCWKTCVKQFLLKKDQRRYFVLGCHPWVTGKTKERLDALSDIIDFAIKNDIKIKTLSELIE